MLTHFVMFWYTYRMRSKYPHGSFKLWLIANKLWNPKGLTSFSKRLTDTGVRCSPSTIRRIANRCIRCGFALCEAISLETAGEISGLQIYRELPPKKTVSRRKKRAA